MRCNASPTTSIAPNVRDVAAGFNALLWTQAFAPLAKSMGFIGDAVVGIAVRDLARKEHGGLTDRLERAIENIARHVASRAVP